MILLVGVALKEGWFFCGRSIIRGITFWWEGLYDRDYLLVGVAL
jgi:hypothetical protein